MSMQREQQRYEAEARALEHAQQEQQRYRKALKQARLRVEGKADAAAAHKARRAAIQQVRALFTGLGRRRDGLGVSLSICSELLVH